MHATHIRPLTPADEDRWRALWAGYLKFYRADVADDVTDHTFARLLDPGSGMGGLVAERDGQVIGLCNYLFHASTWSKAPTCYLQDLFVDPAARGSGAAKGLILACEEAARAAGAFRLYWLTQEYNGPARSLYDTITPRSSFIVYRKGL
jgi:GNAT superfamily N-acetyltransferase